MLLNVILILTSLIFSCARVSSSEEVVLRHNADSGKVSLEIVLRNKMGSLTMHYPYRSDNNYLVLNFTLKTTKPLNLLKVYFNGLEIAHKNLWWSYDIPLELNHEQYFLSFDDSIELTGFYVHLNPALGEHLKFREFARTEGLKLNVECVERGSDVKINFPFEFSISGAQQFFDLVDEF
ncbi:hypothetical protein [Borrelia persica]|uniref:hypothetical protein n=1 Tax=Borrelia persica TaxID=44448 RepID=UPI000465D239|nr:hypothetical protein [Borrelia persica]